MSEIDFEKYLHLRIMKSTVIVIGAIALIIGLLIWTSCRKSVERTSRTEPDTFEKPRTPDWAKNAVIYEVNLRHFTAEGTFASFHQHIPRLKEMGIDILWFMPITPVSVAKRKGPLGSPYAVADYKAVNPDMGTMDDFKAMLKAIQDAGMYCILDWVPNHTGWDNPWITAHPEWYTKDSTGQITDPIDPETGASWGWTDVADLNYDNQEMRLAMIDALRFWSNEIEVDGFRMDVAHQVPADFWAQCTDSLFADRPLYMLSEAETPAIINNGSFATAYGWHMHHTLNQIAKTQGVNEGGKKLVKGNLVEDTDEEVKYTTAHDIDTVLARYAEEFEKGYMMHFTSNHDENSWAGTEFQRMGQGHKAFAVLVSTFDGMPLLYTGQESAMKKQLKFFEKDEVDWGDYVYADFYKTLFDLKHRNQALWNGQHGGALVKIPTGRDAEVYAFTREKNGDQVVVIINLSSNKQDFVLDGEAHLGEFKDVFSGDVVALDRGTEMSLEPWAYLVYSNK